VADVTEASGAGANVDAVSAPAAGEAPRVDVLPERDWATAVASQLAEQIRQRPRLRLCLPTGDTPTPVYAALAALVNEGAASLADVTVVLLDEYVGLERDDPARLDGRLRRELIDVVDAPPAFHPVPVDDLEPDEAARRHDQVAAQGLDLTLLGLGGNGHVGLNEPGSTADSPTRVVPLTPESQRGAVERYGAERAPESGITLGLAPILDSGEIWLLVTGAGKAEVLRRALEGPETPDCPASFLRRHPRLRVIADEPAAARMRAGA
jgi:glucosamine-6-phosphate deaminase